MRWRAHSQHPSHFLHRCLTIHRVTQPQTKPPSSYGGAAEPAGAWSLLGCDCERGGRLCNRRPQLFFLLRRALRRGIHAATDIELYRGTVEWRNGRWTWTGLLTKLPRGHPNHTLPLRWRGVEEPLMGPGNPSTLWLNSSRRRSRESDATPPDRPRTLAARTPGQGICEAPCSTASPSARRRSAPHSSQRRRRPASRHSRLRPDGLARTDHRAARPTRRRRPCRRGLSCVSRLRSWNKPF